MARMKAGKQHWAWSYDLPATFIVVPRWEDAATKYGWKDREHRVYSWKNCMPIHIAGAWETDDGKVYVESSRVHENAFPFFPLDGEKMPSSETRADFVRWELDLSQPSDTIVPDPLVVLDLPSEFLCIDERLMTTQFEWLFLNVFIPENLDGSKSIFHGLKGLAMHDHKTSETKFFYAGDDSLCQEPIYIPRSADAPEGDGWVMTLVERRAAGRCDMAIVDTREFEKPIAIVQLLFHIKAQIHGNWVQSAALKARKSLVKEMGKVKVGEGGTLEPMI